MKKQQKAAQAPVQLPEIPAEAPPVVWGYARVSTSSQETDAQVLALRQAGIAVERIVADVISGGTPALSRPVLSALLAVLRPGDTITVARLDRLGRDPEDVVNLLRAMEERGQVARFLDFGIETRTAAGMLFVRILAAFAGWERDLIRERTKSGLAAARAAGSLLGRKHRLTRHQRNQAAHMKIEGATVAEVARLLGVSRSVAHRAMIGA